MTPAVVVVVVVVVLPLVVVVVVVVIVVYFSDMFRSIQHRNINADIATQPN